MTDESARPLRAVIGEGVRRVREAADLRQDDVSRAARMHGLAWGQSRIAALERGEKAISAEELVLLRLALTYACDREVTLSDLIDPQSRVALSDAVTATGRALVGVLADEDTGAMLVRDLAVVPVALQSIDVPAMTARMDAIRDRAQRLGLATRARDYQPIFARERQIGLTEERTGKRIGEDPFIVAAIANALWGRSLADERDRLVDERADAGADPDRLRALRGRVTRQLVEQVAAEIKRRETGGDR